MLPETTAIVANAKVPERLPLSARAPEELRRRLELGVGHVLLDETSLRCPSNACSSACSVVLAAKARNTGSRRSRSRRRERVPPPATDPEGGRRCVEIVGRTKSPRRPPESREHRPRHHRAPDRVAPALAPRDIARPSLEKAHSRVGRPQSQAEPRAHDERRLLT